MKKPLETFRDAYADAAYEAGLANIEYETAKEMMDQLHPSIEDVEAALVVTNDAMEDHHALQQLLSEMNTDLIEEFERLFNIFDNRAAVENFNTAIEEAKIAMEEFGAQSREAAEANEEVIRALAEVINQLDNIPARTQLEMIADLRLGNFDEVQRQLAIFQAMADQANTVFTSVEQSAAAAGFVMPQSGFQNIPTPYSSIEIGGGAGGIPTRQTTVNSPMQVIINQPAGTDPAETARVLEKAARRNGSLPIPTTGSVRS